MTRCKEYPLSERGGDIPMAVLMGAAKGRRHEHRARGVDFERFGTF